MQDLQGHNVVVDVPDAGPVAAGIPVGLGVRVCRTSLEGGRREGGREGGREGRRCIYLHMWICTSSNTDLVIRSTVSIMFVLNVDELIYETCCPMYRV